MNPSNFLWGIFFLGLGGLFIAGNLGYIHGYWWVALLSMWPVIIILIGLRLIIHDDTLFAVIGFVILLLTFGYVLLPNQYRATKTNIGSRGIMSHQEESVNFDRNSIKTVNLELNSGALDMTVDTLPEGESNGVLYKLSAKDLGTLGIKNNFSADQADINISEKVDGSLVFPGQGYKRSMTILLARGVKTNLKINNGASKIALNLENLSLGNLEINAGASSLETRIGRAADNIDVRVGAGASKMVFWIPKAAGVKATFESGLSSKNLDNEFGFTQSGNTYTSSNYQDAGQKVTLTIKSGATSTTVNNY